MGVPAFCAHWRAFNAPAGSRWRRSSRYFVVTPDSPVNYSGLAVANSRSRRVQSLFILGAPDTVRYTLDSPVNYSGVTLRFREGEEFAFKSPGAPDTVRWCTGHCPVAHRTVRWRTGQSGAPDQGAFGCPFAPLFEPFSLDLFIGLL
jgi:hypothetical protein